MRFEFKKKSAVLPLLLIVVLILTACSGPGSSGGAGGTTVTVTMTEFMFDMSQTTFKTGVSYHFVVTNKGSVAHTMIILPPLTNPTDDQVKSATLAGIDAAGVAAGGTQSFDYTFKDPAPAGKLEAACHLPGHYAAGMHTPITVQ